MKLWAKEISFLSLQAYELDNGIIKLIFLPGMGGRLISLEFYGRELFYYPPNLPDYELDLTRHIEDIASYRRSHGWRLLGGYKTWLGPQDRWEGPPYLDLDSGIYSFKQENSDTGGWIGEMASPYCRETGVQLIRRFILEPNSIEIRLEQGLKNTTAVPVSWSIWDVTMVQGPGTVIFPICPGRPVVSGVKDFFGFEREQNITGKSPLEIKDGVAYLNCQEKFEFKYGSLPDEGWLEGFLPRGDKLIRYRKEFSVHPELPYAHGCAIEVYDSPNLPYFEMEVHSPLYTVEPGETVWFPQVWKFDFVN